MEKKEYYLYVNGQKVKVSEQIYKVYWREREHEKYLEQVDRKNHLLFFSSLDQDGHFADNIAWLYNFILNQESFFCRFALINLN